MLGSPRMAKILSLSSDTSNLQVMRRTLRKENDGPRNRSSGNLNIRQALNRPFVSWPLASHSARHFLLLLMRTAPWPIQVHDMSASPHKTMASDDAVTAGAARGRRRGRRGGGGRGAGGGG